MKLSADETGSEDNMPYATNEELPVPVQRHLPQYAQQIYRKAFNSACAITRSIQGARKFRTV